MVLSSEADARYSPSPDQAMSDMPSLWPVKVRMISPEYASHNFTSLSAPSQVPMNENNSYDGTRKANTPDDASMEPFGLNLREDIDRVCPLSVYRSL